MTKKHLQIPAGDGDAPDFIGMVNKIIIGFIENYQLDELFIINIKNWFDHKWLNYSGKWVVPFYGGGFVPDASLDSVWREKITVPPFHPNRVLSETYYRIKAANNNLPRKPLHSAKESNDNIHNRISNFSKNGLFAWYSSDSVKNQKGSLMVYRVQDEIVTTFYVSFENNNGWKIRKAKDIPVNELTDFITG